MKEQAIDLPCPVCSSTGNVNMIAHVDEIPYFGEHTQVTILCHDCGWRQTDFIPAEGKKAGGWSMVLDTEEKLSARVVRSSSCTVAIPELDLQVNPGSNATGYVSNVEGVLNRFQEIINMVERDLASQFLSAEEDERATLMDQMATLQHMTLTLGNLGGHDAEPISLVLLDPHGHSMILHPDATERDLTVEELAELPVGPDPAVFSNDDLGASS
ncbi:MAG TPA: ZPR1 zinc finger domain-containing protein [Candidatus Poseidoniales archaeon]|nr:MAG TPA: ZPR1 zinc finger domain-containing protein [Candidatus Poseidoniales archaeon]|tara:strand:- start:103 stop:744 length:642 start_codon:yes stop_codon:yes gene_type:complete